MEKNLFVFDVESTSLHGTAFAVGAVVYSPKGELLDSFELLSIEESTQANDWVKENVIPHLQGMPICAYGFTLREEFYQFYMKHKDTCNVWVDCGFPVETNFLSQIVKDKPEEREWTMPYPLRDISTMINIEIDRNELSRLPNLRKHNPLDDAKASATALFYVCGVIQEEKS